MTREEIISKSVDLLSEEFDVDPSTITDEAPLKETLGLDSLDLIDVVVLIDQEFGLSVKATDFVGVKTFNDFYNLIENKLNA